MLKNDYLVVKFGVDTAENDPFKSGSGRPGPADPAEKDTPRAWQEWPSGAPAPSKTWRESPGAEKDLGSGMKTYARLKSNDTSLFPGLVLGCINTDFNNQIVILQHFSRATRFAHFCTARNSIF